MTISNKTTIKTYFETGDFPSQQNFSDFIDSCIFTAETSAQAINGDLNIGGALNVSGAATFNILNIATVSANTGNFTNVNAATVSAATGNYTTLNAATVSAAVVKPTNITGTATNNSASAGSVGEYVFANIPPGASVSLTSGITSNVASISLTAGDWDVWGSAGFAPGASTTQTANVGAISTVTATIPTAPNAGAYSSQVGVATGVSATFAIGMMRISISGTTTVYLAVNSTFGVSTQAAFGFIGARRVR